MFLFVFDTDFFCTPVPVGIFNYCCYYSHWGGRLPPQILWRDYGHLLNISSAQWGLTYCNLLQYIMYKEHRLAISWCAGTMRNEGSEGSEEWCLYDHVIIFQVSIQTAKNVSFAVCFFREKMPIISVYPATQMCILV